MAVQTKKEACFDLIKTTLDADTDFKAWHRGGKLYTWDQITDHPHLMAAASCPCVVLAPQSTQRTWANNVDQGHRFTVAIEIYVRRDAKAHIFEGEEIIFNALFAHQRDRWSVPYIEDVVFGDSTYDFLIGDEQMASTWHCTLPMTFILRLDPRDRGDFV